MNKITKTIKISSHSYDKNVMFHQTVISILKAKGYRNMNDLTEKGIILRDFSVTTSNNNIYGFDIDEDITTIIEIYNKDILENEEFNEFIFPYLLQQ
jgi:hypothetical protein